MPERAAAPDTDTGHRLLDISARSTLDGDLAIASHFIQSAICANTRRTYLSAQTHYRAYCAERGIHPLPVTADHMLAWLACEAASKSPRRTGRTIGSFRSAISTLHAESAWGGQPNPVNDPRVTRFIRGVISSKRTEDAAAQQQKTDSIDITPDLLGEMEAFAITDASHAQIMCWAAACTGTFALLRPNELLGSTQNPERVLQLSQITLFRAGAGNQQQRYPPNGDAAGCHFTIALGATKADQAGRNKPKVVAARPAVQAIWRWLQLRHKVGVDSPALFCLPHCIPLTHAQLRTYLQDVLESMGRGRPHISGKAFRRGGASGLLAAGEQREDAAALGHWKNERMLEIYANTLAKEKRQIEISRRMAL